MARRLVKNLVAGELHHPDGSVETEHAGAVWSLGHRGYSHGRALSVWIYYNEESALAAGARLVIEIGLTDTARDGKDLYEAGRYRELIALYNEQHSDTACFMGVQPGWIQEDG